jgi:hypothetical protein
MRIDRVQFVQDTGPQSASTDRIIDGEVIEEDGNG